MQPLFYKITSYWGGLDGSIMFWVFLLSVFGAIAVKSNRERHRELIPYVIATVSIVQMFFLSVMIVNKNPFATYLIDTPVDGRGLNPLLQNVYMVIHPPSLYTGAGVDDHSVRLWHGGAHYRASRRLVASCRPPLDDVLVVLPVARADARDGLGLRGARVGRLVGMGSGRERRGRCHGSPRRRFCTR